MKEVIYITVVAPCSHVAGGFFMVYNMPHQEMLFWFLVNYFLKSPQIGDRQMKSLLYALTLIMSGFLIFVPASYASGSLPSGGSVTGALGLNQVDTYTFTAEVGDSISLSADATNPTIMYLYNPDGTYRTYGYNLLSVNNLNVAGTYRVDIKTKFATQTASYELFFTNSSTANEHGVLPSGGSVTENLTSNDLDTYTFTAEVGDSISLSADSTEPTIMYLYNPDGTYRTYGYNLLSVNNLNVAGTYRVLIKTKFVSKVTDYELHYFNSSTANEIGYMSNNGYFLEDLTSNDLDSYAFTAEVGDSISLSVDSTEPTIMYLYNPDGTYRTYGYNLLTVNNLNVAGIYRVLIRTTVASKVTDYQLIFTSSGNPLVPSSACRNETVGYGTVQEAAWAAFNKTYTAPLASTDDYEHGGEIYKVCNPNGPDLYNFTYRILGATGGNVDPYPPTVAGWHTHPHTLRPEFWVFSFPTWNLSFINPVWIQGDLGWVMNFNKPLYLGLPRLGVLKVLPAGSTSIIQEQIVPPL